MSARLSRALFLRYFAPKRFFFRTYIGMRKIAENMNCIFFAL